MSGACWGAGEGEEEQEEEEKEDPQEVSGRGKGGGTGNSKGKERESKKRKGEEGEVLFHPSGRPKRAPKVDAKVVEAIGSITSKRAHRK